MNFESKASTNHDRNSRLATEGHNLIQIFPQSEPRRGLGGYKGQFNIMRNINVDAVGNPYSSIT